MLETVVARRYALALFNLAGEQGAVDEVEKDLKVVVEVLERFPQLKRAIQHRLVPPREKKALVATVFSTRVSSLVQRFIGLLVDKHREGYLESILEAYVLYADRARNVVEVNVSSAVPLAEADLRSLGQRLEAYTGKKVRLKTSVDPSLLGGVVVRIGDQLIDGSVKKRLQKMKRLLTQQAEVRI